MLLNICMQVQQQSDQHRFALITQFESELVEHKIACGTEATLKTNNECAGTVYNIPSGLCSLETAEQS